MSAPYRDHLQAIRAALNVDARSLYKPASWQALAVGGYRETSIGGELSKLEAFQQACMTLSFLHHRLPPHLWAVIVVRHQLKSKGSEAERDRARWAIWTAAGHLDYPRVDFARWATANWGGWLDTVPARWDRWADDESSIPTLKRHYGREIKPVLHTMLGAAEVAAHRLLSDGGVIEAREIAA